MGILMRPVQLDMSGILTDVFKDELHELNRINNCVVDLECTSISSRNQMEDRLYKIEKVLTRLYNNIANNIFYDKQVGSFEELVAKSNENKKDL